MKVATSASPSLRGSEIASRMVASPSCQISKAVSSTFYAFARGRARRIAAASNAPQARLSCSSSAISCLSACMPDQTSRITGSATLRA